MIFKYAGPGSKILKDYQTAKKRRMYGPPQRTVLDNLFSQGRIEKENMEKNKIFQDKSCSSSSESNDESDVLQEMNKKNVLRPRETFTFNTENSPSQRSCKARPGQKTKSALKSPHVQASTSKNITCNSNCSENSDDMFKSKDDSQLGNSAHSSSDVYIPPSGVLRDSLHNHK